MQNVLEIHWNFKDECYNLVKIGTEIKAGHFKSYYIPAQVNFIDPKKSKLVRLAYSIHLFKQKIKRKIKKLCQN